MRKRLTRYTYRSVTGRQVTVPALNDEEGRRKAMVKLHGPAVASGIVGTLTGAGLHLVKVEDPNEQGESA